MEKQQARDGVVCVCESSAIKKHNMSRDGETEKKKKRGHKSQSRKRKVQHNKE